MKIAIDLRPLMSGKISGVEVYIQSMLKALFEADSKNQYILWYNSFKNIDIAHFPLNYPNVKLVRTRIPNKFLNLSMSLLRWPKVDRLIDEAIDVLWVPDPRPAPVSDKCKKVTTFHDLSFEDFRHSFSRKTRLWHKILRPRTEAQEADQIIAVSHFTKGQLMDEYGIPPKKIQVVYEAADEHLRPIEMPKSFELIQRKYDLPNEYFLCLSTLEPRKNVSGVLEAFLDWKKDTEAPVALVVGGKEHPRIFSHLNLKKHQDIRLIGFVDEEDKALLYQHSLAFVYPSFYEGFGLPILEAMQCGAPVITSNATSMPEVAGEAALLINPNEPKELKAALHELYRDESMRLGLREKGFEQVKKFSWKKAADEFLVLMQGI